MMKACVVCGEVTDEARCEEHRINDDLRKGSFRERGYDAAWDRLSKRARKLQPFCLHCGATDDLQLDHLPEAWQRKDAGKIIRLIDVQVLCGKCNRRAGDARGKNRSK